MRCTSSSGTMPRGFLAPLLHKEIITSCRKTHRTSVSVFPEIYSLRPLYIHAILKSWDRPGDRPQRSGPRCMLLAGEGLFIWWRVVSACWDSSCSTMLRCWLCVMLSWYAMAIGPGVTILHTKICEQWWPTLSRRTGKNIVVQKFFFLI